MGQRTGPITTEQGLNLSPVFSYFLTNLHSIHWFSTENRLKVVMPTIIHECVGAWISNVIGRACRHGLLPSAWDDTMDIMYAPGRLLISSSSPIKSI